MSVIIFIVLIGLYFLPTIVASHRNHPQVAPIGIVNFFLAWTLIGWVWAMAWSLMAFRDDAEARVIVQTAAPVVDGPSDPVAKQLQALLELRNQGLLTEEEYQEKRKRVLETI